MMQVKRNKVTFTSRIRPELQTLFDEASQKIGIPKTKLLQLALGDICYKILSKLPEAEAKGKVRAFDSESITDVFIHGRLTGQYDYTTLGYYLDIDLPKPEKED